MAKTHYEILNLPPSATQEQLHAAYKALALELHPDRAGAGMTSLFSEITAAWGVLKDPERRRAYDATLRLTRPVCGVCSGEGVVWRQKSFTQRTSAPCKGCGGTGFR